MVNTNFRNASDKYRRVKTKQHLTSGISIGFEWEVPMDTQHDVAVNECWRQAGLDGRGRLWYADRGYNTHFECGGLEFASPVFDTLGQARAHARWLINEVDKTSWLLPSEQGRLYTMRPAPGDRPGPQLPTLLADCGIHVHVKCPNTDRLSDWVSAVLNHSTMKDFLWSVSGRSSKLTRGYSYTHQAESTCWDTTTAGYASFGMMRLNQVTDADQTLEYRMFAGDRAVLLPALDMCHAMTRYAASLYRKHGFFNRTKGMYCEAKDFAQWIKKEKGYKVLKDCFTHELKQLEK